VSPAYGYWPALIAREHVTARCFFGGRSEPFPCSNGPSAVLDSRDEPPLPSSASADRPRVRVPLARVAFARSGDKGDTCNVGLAALRPELYPELLREVTAERVAAYFASTVRGDVTRHRLDNLHAMNFVMRRALDGGGTVSLQLDAQGKTVSQGLLNMYVEIDRELLEAGGARS
jgi:hypothetical protein